MFVPRTHTCKHVERRNVATGWPTGAAPARQLHVCITAALGTPLHRSTTRVETKPAARRAQRLDGWIHRKSCSKYVHILGCFLVWFPRLSRAKKRSWDNRKFLSFVGFSCTIIPQAARVTTRIGHGFDSVSLIHTASSSPDKKEPTCPDAPTLEGTRRQRAQRPEPHSSAAQGSSR